MAVLDDILNGISPAMGPYKDEGKRKLAQLRTRLTAAEAERDEARGLLRELCIDSDFCDGIPKEYSDMECKFCGDAITDLEKCECTNSLCPAVRARVLLAKEEKPYA